MSRYIDILNSGKEALKEAGIEEFANDGWLLFEYAFKISRSEYFIHQREENSDNEVEKQYFHLIAERCKRIPLQHITGYQEFMGFDFIVNEHTLIPRQDTEILVENVINLVEQCGHEACGRDDNRDIHILDMCTGTGCIGISLAKMVPDIKVTAVDVSGEVLKVAVENGKRLNTDNIKFVESNLFEKLDKSIKYDFIVSNPPYIRTKDIEGLMDEVRLYEPVTALDGTADGLYFYREITREASLRIAEGGSVLYEIGCDQAVDVSKILTANGFDRINVIRDLAGLDRVVTGRLHH